jgi:hypothetical protein
LSAKIFQEFFAFMISEAAPLKNCFDVFSTFRSQAFKFVVAGGKVCRRWLWLLCLTFAMTGNSQQIQADAINLPDATPGQDLWRYNYTLGGFNLQANQGFSIFFGYQQYTNLINPRPMSDTSWNVLVVQPDVGLTADGYYDALALVDSPPTGGAFSVDFTWLGNDTPTVAQSFYVYNANFQPIFFGTTVANGGVPEPGTVTLSILGAGLLLGGAAKRRRKL